MAVLNKVPGLSATIHVDGKQAVEYDDDEEGETPAEGDKKAAVTITRYIESISDAEYSVNIEVERAFIFNCPALEYRLKIDGKIISALVVKKSSRDFYLNLEQPMNTSFLGITSKQVSGRGDILSRFRFAKIGLSGRIDSWRLQSTDSS